MTKREQNQELSAGIRAFWFPSTDEMFSGI